MAIYLFTVWDLQGISDASVIKIDIDTLPNALVSIRKWLVDHELPETNYSLMIGV